MILWRIIRRVVRFVLFFFFQPLSRICTFGFWSIVKYEGDPFRYDDDSPLSIEGAVFNVILYIIFQIALFMGCIVLAAIWEIAHIDPFLILPYLLWCAINVPLEWLIKFFGFSMENEDGKEAISMCLIFPVAVVIFVIVVGFAFLIGISS